MTETPLNLDEVGWFLSAGRNCWKSHIPNKVDIINVFRDQTGRHAHFGWYGRTERRGFHSEKQQGVEAMLADFLANRLLLVVDGIEMNNAIFRSGNLQNIVSVDPASLESIEVLPDPGSVIYGSDALGGVLSLNTFRPEFSSSGNWSLKDWSFWKALQPIPKKPFMEDGKPRTKLGFLISEVYSGFDDWWWGKTVRLNISDRNMLFRVFFNGMRQYFVKKWQLTGYRDFPVMISWTWWLTEM